jgi:hypothetical protein
MNSTEDRFQTYLRTEMDSAGETFETARARVFALLNASDLVSRHALLGATEEMAEAMRLYLGAIRRFAHFAANHQAQREEKALARHASAG